MSFKINPLTAVDSYKLSHRLAYPEGIEYVYSNFTPRSTKHLNVPFEFKNNEIVWAGAQAVINDLIELWNEEFFSLDSRYFMNKKEIDAHFKEPAIAAFLKRVAPFVGGEGYATQHLEDLFDLGYLPLEIKTLPEGSRVPVGVPVLTIQNTDHRFFWLTNYIETYLSAELWKISTSATIADVYRQIGLKWYEETGADIEFLDFAFHDFSYRGLSGSIDAAKSGIGHLLSFKGTDTIPAVDYAAYHYDGDNTFVGASVPAMEHSVQTAYENNDYNYIKRIITEIYPKGIVSVVVDGYDYWAVLTETIPQLREEIVHREGKVVLRPDSGDPVHIIAGYTYLANTNRFDNPGYEVYKNQLDDKFYFADNFEFNEYGDVFVKEGSEPVPEHVVKGSIQVLWDIFGGTINSKGFQKLSDKIGLIYGDSITPQRSYDILKRLAWKNFSSDNIVFGVGSYTYQYNTRDTLGFAMKATNIVVNGKDIPLWKDPKTDDGTKKSAKGYLKVIKEKGTFKLIDNVSFDEEQEGELTTLVRDGEFYKRQSLENVRAILKVASCASTM